jgi:hypothetical protein
MTQKVPITKKSLVREMLSMGMKWFMTKNIIANLLQKANKIT